VWIDQDSTASERAEMTEMAAMRSDKPATLTIGEL